MPQTACQLPRAGDTPIPGYQLLEPLGEGGYGVVWKCRAPGGLCKAIKFVRQAAEGACPATQELVALERVKELRHPFLLSLERVEVQADGTVLIVMELADESLHALFDAARAQGLPGVPREELLGYLDEAAEALDWMNEGHGLQHLDVKPHNLLLISGHVKIADFGLVHQLGESSEGGQVRKGGITPLYSAPEMLRGTFSRHSDQYSLAVVYQQLLTGTVPFWHDNVYDLMMQHLSAEPDLTALSEADQLVVARSLAKVPEHRYASCRAFVAALRGGPTATLRRSGAWRRVLAGPGDGGSVPTQPTQVTPPATLLTPPTWAEDMAPSHDEVTRRIRAVAAPVVPSRLPPAAPDLPAEPPLREPAPGEPLPTAITLPSYRFLTCVAQGLLGDLWHAEDGAGRPKRAVAVLNFVRYDARLIGHLQALRDPALPPTEVHWSAAERLVVLTDRYDGTLRDRFEERRAEGHPGVPRGELLGLLRWVAVTLDGLYARHGLQHLGLHPRNLLVEDDRLWVAEFGLVPLLWLPTGQSAATLNGRYAAPELHDRRPSRNADQYALALIYAEMLTGAHPRPTRAASGMLGRVGGARPSGVMRAAKIDLALVPRHDREVLLRALAPDPAQRFPTCTAFIEALEAAGAEREPESGPCLDLPQVIPYASLLGEPASLEVVLPSVPQLVKSLTTRKSYQAVGPDNLRYVVRSDGSWEHRCLVEVPFPGALALMVEGLRAHWGARSVARGDGMFRLVIDLEVPRTFWQRCVRKAHRLQVDVEANLPTGQRRAEAMVRLRYLDGDEGEQQRILAATGPQVFESAREHFRAASEQRARDRVPLTLPLRVYPVLPDLELGTTLEGACRDISPGGIRFRLPSRPQSDQLYLHLYTAPQTLGYALLARVTRVVEVEGGVEVGARFGAE